MIRVETADKPCTICSSKLDTYKVVLNGLSFYLCILCAGYLKEELPDKVSVYR